MAVPTGYTPSPYAHLFPITLSGVTYTLALDIFTYGTPIGQMVEFALLQQAPDGHWDYFGSMAPANNATEGNDGKIWTQTIGIQQTYVTPQGTVLTNDFTSICNEEQNNMCLGWLAKLNAALARVFNPASPPSGIIWPAADWTTAMQNLQLVIRDHIQVVNGQLVAK